MKPKKNTQQTGKELLKDLKNETARLDKKTASGHQTLKKPVFEDDCQGIQPDEFKVANHFKFTKRNLTYKIVLTGIFLALSLVVSGLDLLFEMVQIPIGQVYVTFRFLDLIVLLLALPVLGLVFASLISLVEPIFHNLIHGMSHGWIQPLTDMITNPLILFVTWIFFYIIFKNSPYHKDPDKKKDWFKRLTPAAILVVVTALITTLSFILALYIQDQVSGTNLVPNPNEETVQWEDFQTRFAVMFFAVFGINLFRYFLAFSCFVVFEGKMRAVNHRYR